MGGVGLWRQLHWTLPALVLSIEQGSPYSCQVGKFRRRQLRGTWSRGDCPVHSPLAVTCTCSCREMEAGTEDACHRSSCGVGVLMCMFLKESVG